MYVALPLGKVRTCYIADSEQVAYLAIGGETRGHWGQMPPQNL